MITDFISKKKNSPLYVFVTKTDALSMSSSWDTLHKIKDEEETTAGQMETFVINLKLEKKVNSKRNTLHKETHHFENRGTFR